MPAFCAPMPSNTYSHDLQQKSCGKRHEKNGESGFMLAGTGVVILVIIALLSSFAFVANRDARYRGHFAAGEIAANLVASSHVFAQQYYHYTLLPGTPVMMGDELYDGAATTPLMNPADDLTLRPVGIVSYSANVRGWHESPINNVGVVPDTKAVSAYVHIRVRTPTGTEMLPSDRVAFMAGAAKRGLSRVGYVGMNIPAGDVCDGSADVAVRWGPESSACLTDQHLNDLGFTDVQDGDIIVPAWETALAIANRDALYRFKQPERPDLNTMHADIDMGDNAITGANRMVASTIDAAAGTTTIDTMLVRNGQTTTFNNSVDMNAAVDILDSTNPVAMNVDGTVNFNMTPTTSVSVATAIENNGSALNVDITNPVGINLLESTGTTMDVVPHNAGDSLVVAATNFGYIDEITSSFVAGALSSLTLNGEDKTLVIAGNLNGNAALRNETGEQLNLYTGHFSTNVNLLNPVTMTLTATSDRFVTGAVEQIGNASNRYLWLPTIHTFDCHGFGCPDYVTSLPGGGL